MALSFPVIVSCIALTVEPAIRGTAMAAYTFTLFVGVSLGAWLASRLEFADLALGYLFALFACAILTISKPTSTEKRIIMTASAAVSLETVPDITLHLPVPAGYGLVSRRTVSVDGERADLTRHERTDGRNAGLGGEHFSTVIDGGGRLKGFVRFELGLTEGNFPAAIRPAKWRCPSWKSWRPNCWRRSRSAGSNPMTRSSASAVMAPASP